MSILLTALAILRPAPAASQATERLYQEACDGGDLTACNVFGLINETGQGVPQDLGRASALYQRACEGGELVGCTNLGLLYVAGLGLPPDTAQAAGFFRIACEGGETLGCGLLRALQATRTVAPIERHEKAGRVGDALTNRPLSDALVELPELGIRVLSDGEGRFALTDIPAGTHPIRAERLGYEPLVGTVVVPGDSRFVMLMTPAEFGDVDALGQIVGQVLERAERGLADVDVSVVGQDRARTLSNQQGRFTIRDVEPGVVVVRFARIGYAPRSATLVVQAGRTAEVAAIMVVQPIELEPIEVSIRSLDLEREGFYERAARGWGRHFTPSDLDRLQPTLLSDLLQGRVPGVRLSPLPLGGYALVNRRSSTFTRGSCNLAIYLDGVQLFEPDVDRIPMEWLMAAEVYTGAGTPIQYNPEGCGALLLWTRRGS
jgi:hypothetical protein